jgi:hypothetical protein
MGDGHRWKRLTVSEAAEILQISNDAVRKRVQRGTLPHDRTLDGHVYVYLDAEKGVDGADPYTRKSNAEGESRGRLLQLADVAALVGVVSASTYIVGLFVFWYPISMTYTGDFATAWYATSLVSRNVVVGHGIQKLLLPYLALMLVYWASWLLPYYIGTRPRLRDKPAYVKHTFALVLVTLLWAAVITLLIANYVGVFSLRFMAIMAVVGEIWSFGYFLWYRLRLSNRSKRVKTAIAVALILFTLSLTAGTGYYLGTAGVFEGVNVPLVSSAIAISFVVLGVALSYAATKLQQSIPEPVGHALDASSFGESLQRLRFGWRASPRRYIGVLSLTFAAYFVVILSVSIYDTTPPLPRVEISGQRPVNGKLLTHADRFWYVFKQQEDKQETKLVAIPDDKVEDVQVIE